MTDRPPASGEPNTEACQHREAECATCGKYLGGIVPALTSLAEARATPPALDEAALPEPSLDRAALYVALAHLGRWVMRWRWWDDSKEDWTETDSADFGDAIADKYDETMRARLSEKGTGAE
jgi:hypothetical protein